MTSPDPRAIAIFRGALDQPAAARARFVDDACGGDAALYAHVMRLLARAGDADGDDGDATSDSADRQDGVPSSPALERLRALDAAADADRPRATRDRHDARVGAFRVTRPIGAGGMGDVWLGERVDGGFAQTVAIKWLATRRFDTDALARFERERAILARLEHPGIARVVDGGSDDGVPWFAMEYVDGVPIDRWVADTRPTLPVLLALVAELAAAVQYAHQHLVVHRDIKPSNVLVDAAGAPRLIDFGIAKALGDDDALTRTRAPLTFAYAAPEQLAGDAVTTATDVYALGALLHELVTGAAPHGATDDLARRLHAVSTTEPPPASRTLAAGTTDRPWSPAQLRGDLDTIIAKCLSRDPARRYASAQGVRDDLRRFLDGKPIEARPDSTLYRWRKQVERHPVATALGALAIASLIALSVFSLVQAQRASREAARSAQAADLARQQAERANAVQDFLIGLFAGQSPDATGGKEVSARQLLDDAERALDANTALAPTTYTALTETLATLRRELGDDPGAWRLLDRHIAATAKAFGEDSPEYGTALLIRVSYPRGDRPGTVFDDCRRGLALVPGDARYGARRGVGLLKCASAFQDHERYDDARRAIDEAERLLVRYGDDRAERTLEVPFARATLAFDQRDFDATVAHYDAYIAALDAWPAAPPSHRPLILFNRGLAQYDRGRIDDAIADLREALVLNTRLYGANHPHAVNNALKLASYLVERGRLEESAALAKQALATARATYGPRDDRLGYALADGAVIAYASGDDRAARDLTAEAIVVMTAVYAPDNADTLAMMNNLATLQRKAGEFDAAQATARDVLARLGPAKAESYAARQAHSRLGFLGTSVLDPRDGVRAGEFILAARAKPGADPGPAAEETEALELIARGVRATGTPAEARAAVDRLLSRAHEILTPDDVPMRNYHGIASRVALDAGDFPRALELSTVAVRDPDGGTALWIGNAGAEAVLVHRCATRALKQPSPVKDFEARFAKRRQAQTKDEARTWTQLARCAESSPG